MRTPLIALSLYLLLPISTFAQTTETDTTETQVPSVEDQLSFADENGGDPKVGETYIGEQFGDWEMRCIKAEEGNDPCQMYQLMSDNDGAPIAEISIFRLPEGGRALAGATVIVPLETSLADQLSLQVDTGAPRRYPFAFCNPIGCYSRIGLIAAEVDEFKRGNTAELNIVPAMAPDQRVRVLMSLSGFTAAYDRTSVIDR
jgi:invasion protein IalB